MPSTEEAVLRAALALGAERAAQDGYARGNELYVLVGIAALAATDDSSQAPVDILGLQPTVQIRSNGEPSASFQDYLATLMAEGFKYGVAIRWLLGSVEVVNLLGVGRPEAKAAVSRLLSRAEYVYERHQTDGQPRIVSVGETGGEIESLRPE